MALHIYSCFFVQSPILHKYYFSWRWGLIYNLARKPSFLEKSLSFLSYCNHSSKLIFHSFAGCIHCSPSTVLPKLNLKRSTSMLSFDNLLSVQMRHLTNCCNLLMRHINYTHCRFQKLLTIFAVLALHFALYLTPTSISNVFNPFKTVVRGEIIE